MWAEHDTRAAAAWSRLIGAARRRLRRLLRGTAAVNRLVGPFPTWAAAVAASQGYHRQNIVEKTREAMRRVQRGEAVYERDSVVFDRIHYSWPLLSGLLWVAAQRGGTLNVLDFGGALGSSFSQNREFLSSLRSCRWNVVEQPAFVAAGQAEFAQGGLHFYDSIAACLAETRPSLALLSGVLGYLPEPEVTLQELAAAPIEFLILDRTAFSELPYDQIYVQHVPAVIYAASYPCRILSRPRLRERLQRDWQIISEHHSSERLAPNVAHGYGGLIARRRSLPADRPARETAVVA